jgi:hypothetical protein
MSHAATLMRILDRERRLQAATTDKERAIIRTERPASTNTKG